MPSVNFYFQVHQPWRVKRYRIFDVGKDSRYFNDRSQSNLNNERVLKKVAAKCYLPTNELLYQLLKRYPNFRFSFSFSGVFLEQLESFAPEVLDSFKRLIATGRVEVLAETYYHSLAALYSNNEFVEQVRMHGDKVKGLFGVTPRVFRNTELIYSNEIAALVASLGYRGILAEGAERVLGWRSPNFAYRPSSAPALTLLLKNYRLSDDIAFRFSSREWADYPLTAPKFASWVSALNGNGQLVNLFMDYETFGEHQWEDTGIFHFLEALPAALLKERDTDFVTVGEAVERYAPTAELDVPEIVSWADVERDLSAWRSNEIQHDALARTYALEEAVRTTGDRKLLEDWRRLQTSDHFYYMCTKWWQDGDVHKYFNPYESPYDAYISFVNVLEDLKQRLSTAQQADSAV